MKRRDVFLALILTIVLLSVSTLAGCSKSTDEQASSPGAVVKGQMVKVPSSAENYIGQSFETVSQELKKAGFTEIEATVIEDLTSDSDIKDGAIETITIDGSSFFQRNDEFPLDAKVEIVYHIIPKIAVPVDSSELDETSFESIGEVFSSAGFVNVSVSEAYDLDPDEIKEDHIIECSVNGREAFKEGDLQPFDSKIIVICHYPYEKYTVKMAVDFIPNLFFNKYDVDLMINGEKYDALKHGEDGNFEFRLREGDYTVTFANATDSSVKGEVSLSVYCDIEASYEIWCYGDYVTVKELFVDYQKALMDDEAKIMGTEYAFRDRNYKNVVKELTELGFINIKTVPVYDIIWGITETESTKQVTIAEKTDYKRGDIFKNNVEVIVYYHMPSEDDPARVTPTPSAIATPAPSTTPKPTATPTPTPASVFYSTNDRETAKKGNTGIFAYKSYGGTYDNYYVIDFDEGYVYFFSEGNGSETCDRVQIASGNLNDVLIITYHDGGDTWSYGLHFKWKNQPDILILQDESGYEIEFYTTFLSDALNVRDKKTIYDY